MTQFLSLILARDFYVTHSYLSMDVGILKFLCSLTTVFIFMLVKEAFQITLNDFSVLAFSYLFLI